MRHYLLPAIAILIPLGNAFAQDAVDPAAERPSGSGAAPAVARSQSDAAGRSGEVSPEVIRALREMALEAERKAAQPTPPKSEEAVAAERKAIDAHRDGLFARAQERQ